MKDMEQTSLKRNIFQRIFGRCATREPGDSGCWENKNGEIAIDLDRTPELSQSGSGIRLEGGGFTERVLVIHGDGDSLHAFRNRCGHGGRRLDPVPGTHTVQCCSLGKSTYDYDGKVLSGPTKEAITCYPTRTKDRKLFFIIK